MHGETRANDPLLLYFTSGTTARPTLVVHTHQSYPVGHLSTLYWIGLQEADVHLNLSSPGWAKHAWSNVFAPWNAGATVFVCNYARFDALRILDVLARYPVTTLCAPPTVWRMLIGEDLTAFPVRLREAVSAGEPLNPGVIDQVRLAWGISIRDGYGQTETTAQIGNPPGQPLKEGSMGRPLPGYRVMLLDSLGNSAEEGELCLSLEPAPLGLMPGYLDDVERTEVVFRDGYYRTGDVARRDEDGYITFVGRTDDVFKSSDYRTIGSVLSSWRVCSSSTPRSPRRPSCRVPIQGGVWCRRRTSHHAVSNPHVSWRSTFSALSACAFRHSNACAGLNSENCPRPSPERLGESNCVQPRTSALTVPPALGTNTGKKTFPSCEANRVAALAESWLGAAGDDETAIGHLSS
jgi:hypothetical protein